MRVIAFALCCALLLQSAISSPSIAAEIRFSPPATISGDAGVKRVPQSESRRIAAIRLAASAPAPTFQRKIAETNALLRQSPIP